MMKRIIVLSALFSSVISCATFQDSDESLTLRKSFPVQVFMGACVAGRADPSAVGYQAREMGFEPADGELALRYLKGDEGVAWQLNSQDQGGLYGLAVAENTLCSSRLS